MGTIIVRSQGISRRLTTDFGLRQANRHVRGISTFVSTLNFLLRAPPFGVTFNTFRFIRRTEGRRRRRFREQYHHDAHHRVSLFVLQVTILCLMRL